MVPRIVLVDPELAVSVPPHITAWTGMDAITQLIESYLSRRATPATQRICLSAMNETVASLVTAFREGRSREARERMALAALTSGITLANSGLGMAHGVAAALGVHCQVPHGLACAVMLPAAMRTNLDDEATKKQFFAMASMIISLEKSTEIQMARFKERRPGAPISFEEFHALGVREHTQAAIARIDTLLDELKIPRRLSEIGVKREQIPVLVRDSRGNSMSGNPREISDEELTRILEEMF
jgi:alcohol dehydrogenase class IV